QAGRVLLDRKEVDLAAVMATAVGEARPAADAKGIRIESNIDSSLGPIWGDPVRLQQVVWNLLSNAIRFTPTSGSVRVSLKRRDTTVELSVTDTGIGITPEFKPRLFKPFSQANSSSTRAQGGFGIGLAIVRLLVELHSGTVAASSSGQGKGSTFLV